MRLYYGPASPYVRMVRATAMAKGLDDRIEVVNARAEPEAYESITPLNKVPALITDAGEVLIESKLICQYLDDLGGPPRLYPEEAAALRRVLQRQAVIQGVLDAAILRFNEARREAHQRSQWWDTRQERKVARGLDRIEAECDAYTAPDTVLPIVLGCAIGFIDRPDIALVDYDWRTGHPRMAAWFEEFSASPLMTETDPMGPRPAAAP